MKLPIELQQIIKEIILIVFASPNHALIPVYRNDIYKALYSVNNFKYYQIRGWLEIITAQRVLFIWQQLYPNDKLPDALLQLAKDILYETESLNIAEAELKNVWKKLAEESGIEGKPSVYLNAYNARQAAIQALNWIVRKPGFLEFDKYNTDWDWMDPTSDAAMWAAAAYAGPVWVTISDITKRLEFWEWWLTEAIPQAWELAQQNNSSH